MIMKGINSQITLMKTVSHDLEFLVFRAFPCKKDEWGKKKQKQKTKKQRLHSLADFYVHAQLLQSCLTLCDSMDRNPQGFSLSMGFSRQNSGMGSHFLLQGDLPNPRIKPTAPAAPALHVDSLPTELPGKLRFLRYR